MFYKILTDPIILIINFNIHQGSKIDNNKVTDACKVVNIYKCTYL